MENRDTQNDEAPDGAPGLQGERRGTVLALLGEKYQSIHIMRKRVETYFLATMGFLVALLSWTIQTTNRPCLLQSILMSVVVCVGMGAVGVQIRDIRKGFNSTWSVVRNMEGILGCWSVDHFGKGTGTIYPQTWQDTGTAKGGGYFFCHCFLFLAFGAVVALATIWLRFSL